MFKRVIAQHSGTSATSRLFFSVFQSFPELVSRMHHAGLYIRAQLTAQCGCCLSTVTGITMVQGPVLDVCLFFTPPKTHAELHAEKSKQSCNSSSEEEKTIRVIYVDKQTMRSGFSAAEVMICHCTVRITKHVYDTASVVFFID